MKNYSSNAITAADVDAKVGVVRTAVSEVDTKQTEQIQKLRTLLVISFVVNLLVAAGAYFF